MALLDLTGFVLAHDPVIVREGNTYWRFQTGPGIPVSSSSDLKNWTYRGKVFNENPEWTKTSIPGSTDFWAPEVVYRNGRWRIYYAVSTFGKNKSAIGLAETKTLDPSSPDFGWTDRGAVLLSKESDNYNAIDPAVAADEKGRDYFLFGSFWGGLVLFPLEEDGTITKGSEALFVASRQTEPNPVEGGFIFKEGDWYYLFASHDFCCRGTASSYHIVVGRSRSITGPYLDKAGVPMTESGGSLLRDGSSHKRWAGPGHNSVFRDTDGKIYLVYHAYDRENNGLQQLQIEPMTFEKGWPCLS